MENTKLVAKPEVVFLDGGLFWTRAIAWFNEHLLIMNILSAAACVGVADCLVQIFHDRSSHSADNWVYNPQRTARTAVIGTVIGALSHVWYTSLDSLLTEVSLTTLAMKLFLDQICAGPFFATIFIVGNSFLEGHSATAVYEEWGFKFPHIYKVDWMFWPPAQFVNFLFVPDHLRVLYVNVASLVWNLFLTYVKHMTGQEQVLVNPPD